MKLRKSSLLAIVALLVVPCMALCRHYTPHGKTPRTERVHWFAPAQGGRAGRRAQCASRLRRNDCVLQSTLPCAQLRDLRLHGHAGRHERRTGGRAAQELQVQPRPQLQLKPRLERLPRLGLRPWTHGSCYGHAVEPSVDDAMLLHDQHVPAGARPQRRMLAHARADCAQVDQARQAPHHRHRPGTGQWHGHDRAAAQHSKPCMPLPRVAPSPSCSTTCARPAASRITW